MLKNRGWNTSSFMARNLACWSWLIMVNLACSLAFSFSNFFFCSVFMFCLTPSICFCAFFYKNFSCSTLVILPNLSLSSLDMSKNCFCSTGSKLAMACFSSTLRFLNFSVSLALRVLAECSCCCWTSWSCYWIICLIWSRFSSKTLTLAAMNSFFSPSLIFSNFCFSSTDKLSSTLLSTISSFFFSKNYCCSCLVSLANASRSSLSMPTNTCCSSLLKFLKVCFWSSDMFLNSLSMNFFMSSYDTKSVCFASWSSWFLFNNLGAFLPFTPWLVVAIDCLMMAWLISASEGFTAFPCSS